MSREPQVAPEPKPELTTEQLAEECRGLLRLLEDPHPGLITWQMAVARRREAIGS